MFTIDELIQTRKYYSGSKLKEIPVPAMEYRRYHRSLLSSRTIINLRKISHKFGVEWTDYLAYNIHDYVYYHTKSIRSGFIIYGVLPYQKQEELKHVTFFRKETTSPQAGQTLLYFGNGKPIHVSSLFKPSLYNPRLLKKMTMWCDQVRPYIDLKYEEIESKITAKVGALIEN